MKVLKWALMPNLSILKLHQVFEEKNGKKQ